MDFSFFNKRKKQQPNFIGFSPFAGFSYSIDTFTSEALKFNDSGYIVSYIHYPSNAYISKPYFSYDFSLEIFTPLRR